MAPSETYIPTARYLVASGRGEPGGPVFQAAVGALYSVAYTIKFRSKARGRDFRVMGLEGLWGTPEGGPLPPGASVAQLPWRLLIRVPDFVRTGDLRAAKRELEGKGRTPPSDVQLERIREGRCIQALHVGPYAEEPRTVARITELAGRDGVTLRGPHHELYLSDPRRVPAERLRTILRYPVGP